jgi:hypothetical protein
VGAVFPFIYSGDFMRDFISVEVVNGSDYFNDRVEVEWKTDITPAMEARIANPFSSTGYGKNIPTTYKVKYNGRWYRVYSICYSNVLTEYIRTKTGDLIVKFY